jgi:hypothetical protein
MDNEFANVHHRQLRGGQDRDRAQHGAAAHRSGHGRRCDDLVDKLRDIGAVVADDTDADRTRPADGVLPDEFYATTNFETEVRVDGRWLRRRVPEMDCAIVIDADGARTVAPPTCKAGDRGGRGPRRRARASAQRPRRKAVFEFMSSAVSSEKPRRRS